MLTTTSNIAQFPAPSTVSCALPMRAATLRRAMPLLSPAIDVAALAELAAHDPGLAFHLLGFANPIQPEGNPPIYRLEEAIFFCENETVRSMLLHPFARRNAAIEILGAHSRLTALIARRMAELTTDCEPNQAYIAGLLHDVGKLESSGVCTDKSHSSLGRDLAVEACLPLFLVDAIANHHRPEAAEIDPQLVRIVSLADQVAHGLASSRSAGRTSATDTLRNGIALFRQSDPAVISSFFSASEWFPAPTISSSNQFDRYTQ